MSSSGDKEFTKLVPMKTSTRGTEKSLVVSEEQAKWGGPGAWDGKSPRRPGFLKGKMIIHDSFYDPWSAKDFSPGIMDDDPEWGDPDVWDGKTPRKPGSMKGQITLDDTFF